MRYYYSPSRDSFYVEDFKDIYIKNNAWPHDAMEVNHTQFVEFSLNIAPIGKKRKMYSNELVWEDTVISQESLSTEERDWRNGELVRSDIELNKVQDSDPKSVGSVSHWRNYRKSLRAWPEDSNFPNQEFRPKAPDAGKEQ